MAGVNSIADYFILLDFLKEFLNSYSMWQQHIRVCLWFIVIAIPIAIADFLLLGKSNGGFINLSGFLIGAYALFLVIHLVVSSSVLKLFPSLRIGATHILSVILSIIILWIGVRMYIDFDARRLQEHYEERQTQRLALINILELNSWKYSPNAEQALEIIIDVTVHESGRFAVNVNGYTDVSEVENDWFFQSDNPDQKWVNKEEHFIHRVPLKREHEGVPKNIELTLYLFADSTGSASEDIIKTYVFQPKTADDGTYFYGTLPPASPF